MVATLMVLNGVNGAWMRVSECASVVNYKRLKVFTDFFGLVFGYQPQHFSLVWQQCSQTPPPPTRGKFGGGLRTLYGKRQYSKPYVKSRVDFTYAHGL